MKKHKSAKGRQMKQMPINQRDIPKKTTMYQIQRTIRLVQGK